MVADTVGNRTLIPTVYFTISCQLLISFLNTNFKVSGLNRVS
jgi:hypothetical protein